MNRSTPPADEGWLRDAKVIAIVAIAHFVSHVHIMLLPPIFLLVKDEFGVSYTEIALALTAYNVVSALLQTPAGFLVDRIGARVMLTGGLILERRRDLRRGPAAGLLVLPDRATPCWASPTPSITRPTIRSCRPRSTASASARRSRSTPSRAISAAASRRPWCWPRRRSGAGTARFLCRRGPVVRRGASC